jgi:hypothetical protein
LKMGRWRMMGGRWISKLCRCADDRVGIEGGV